MLTAAESHDTALVAVIHSEIAQGQSARQPRKG